MKTFTLTDYAARIKTYDRFWLSQEMVTLRELISSPSFSEAGKARARQQLEVCDLELSRRAGF